MKRCTLSLCGTLLAASFAMGFSTTDKPEGWASQSGGTTGGTGGAEVTVSTMADLQAQAKSSGKKIILVNKGTYTGTLSIASEKTILGKEPGVVIKGNVRISAVNNVILRNLAIQGNRCATYEECKAGDDALSISSEAHHIWLDHLDISDGQDGNCDITNGSDFVTVTWSKFWYSYDKEHRFSNLIAADDNLAIDKDKLRITYAYNWWADRVVERQPRGRAGKVHVVNNLYTSTATNYACGPGVEIQMLIENNVFKNAGTAIKEFTGTPAAAWKTVGNTGTATGIATNKGTVFTPPYSLSEKMVASEVESKVKPAAGNTMTLKLSGIRKGAGVGRNPAAPYVEGAAGGWVLRNPGAERLRFQVVDLGGKLLVRETALEPHGAFALPTVTNSVVVQFSGADRSRDIHLSLSR